MDSVAYLRAWPSNCCRCGSLGGGAGAAGAGELSGAAAGVVLLLLELCETKTASPQVSTKSQLARYR